jgi:hypothetical protein
MKVVPDSAITHLSEVRSVSLSSGLGSGNLVCPSGSSSSLEGDTDSSVTNLEVSVWSCTLPTVPFSRSILHRLSPISPRFSSLLLVLPADNRQ